MLSDAYGRVRCRMPWQGARIEWRCLIQRRVRRFEVSLSLSECVSVSGCVVVPLFFLSVGKVCRAPQIRGAFALATGCRSGSTVRDFRNFVGEPISPEGHRDAFPTWPSFRMAVFLCWGQHTFRSFWDFAREEIQEPPHRRPVKRGEPHPGVGVPWAVVDSINLSDFFRERWTVLQSCPFQFRGGGFDKLSDWLWRHVLKRSPGKMQSRNVHGSCSVFCPVTMLRKPRGPRQSLQR